MKKNQKVFCYFHNDDLDGWASSAVVLKKYPNAEFCGYNYEEKLPKLNLVQGYDIVFMVDCSCSIAEMNFLDTYNKKFIWIDHHAKKIWEILKKIKPDGLLDEKNKHSACVLTWKYLYPKKRIPLVLRYIEDVDLWKFELPHSNEINMTLNIETKENRGNLASMLTWMTSWVEVFLRNGLIYSRMQRDQIDFLLKTMKVINFHGYKTGVVNSPLHTSFVGHRILEKNPQIQVALIWYCYGDDILCSLRSRGNISVADIASKYGGGGHKPASGFRIKKDVIKGILEGETNEQKTITNRI